MRKSKDGRVVAWCVTSEMKQKQKWVVFPWWDKIIKFNADTAKSLLLNKQFADENLETAPLTKCTVDLH